MEEILKAITEIQQSRSRFQLEKFVIGQHYSKEMQYFQVCLELQDMIYKYRNAEIGLKIQEKKIEKLRKSGDEIKELKAQQLELGLEQSRIVMIGAQRELAHLVDIWNSFDVKYTREQIELAQPEYWVKRLTTNADMMMLGGAGVNPSHLETMLQVGMLDDFLKSKMEIAQEIEQQQKLN